MQPTNEFTEKLSTLRSVLRNLSPGNAAYLCLRLIGLNDLEISALVLAIARKDVSADALRQRMCVIRKEILNEAKRSEKDE